MTIENPEDSQDNTIEPEKPPGRATDMELALFFAAHINNPCEVDVSEDKRENIRGFYLREARRALGKIANEGVRKFLEDKIKEYEK